MKQLRDLLEDPGEQPFRPDKTYQVFLIGDRSASLIVASRDKGGHFMPLDVFPYFFTLDLGVSPGVQQMLNAFEFCWKRMREKYRVRFKGMILCLPECVTKGYEVAETLRISHEEATQYPEVSEDHVRALQEKCLQQVDQEKYEFVGLKPHHYTLDTGRVVDDPVKETSTTLDLCAYVTLAERGPLRKLLKAMAKKELDVASVFTASDMSGGLLAEHERQYGTIVIEIDTDHMSCSFYLKGQLKAEHSLPYGSQCIQAHAAVSMSVDIAELQNALEDTPEFRIASDSHAVIRVGDRRKAPVSLDILMYAARHVLLRCGAEIVEFHASCSRCSEMPIQKIVISGDDYFSTRALKEHLRKQHNLPTERPVDDLLALCSRMNVPNAWRAIGGFKLAMLDIEHRRHIAIERYAQPVEKRVKREIRLWTWIAKELHTQHMIRLRDKLIASYETRKEQVLRKL